MCPVIISHSFVPGNVYISLSVLAMPLFKRIAYHLMPGQSCQDVLIIRFKSSKFMKVELQKRMLPSWHGLFVQLAKRSVRQRAE